MEYALRYVQHPVGVATYRLRDTLPEPLQGNLPTIEQLEMELKTIDLEPDDRESNQNER